METDKTIQKMYKDYMQFVKEHLKKLDYREYNYEVEDGTVNLQFNVDLLVVNKPTYYYNTQTLSFEVHCGDDFIDWLSFELKVRKYKNKFYYQELITNMDQFSFIKKTIGKIKNIKKLTSIRDHIEIEYEYRRD